MNEQTTHNEDVANEPTIDEPQEIVLRSLKDKEGLLFLMIMWYIYKSQNLT